MKRFVTEIQAIDPQSGKMKTWMGPYVPANSYSEADQYCQRNGMGYCKVVGELVSEVNNSTGTLSYRIEKRPFK